MTKLNEFKKKVMKYTFKGFWNYLIGLEAGLNGNIVLSCTPATIASSAAAVNAAIGGAAAKFARTVVVRAKDSDGNILTWLNKSFAIAVTETGDNGVIAIKDGATTAAFVNGEAIVVLEYTGAWVAANTATLTITGGAVLGYTVANKTSVDTLAA